MVIGIRYERDIELISYRPGSDSFFRVVGVIGKLSYGFDTW